MKRVVIIALISTMMIGLSGCMFIQNGNSIYKQMVEYMEEKYGEEFTFIEATGTNKIKGSSQREATVSTERFPREQISVMADKDEDGNYYFRDNYVSFLLRDEIEKLLTEIAAPIYKDCKVIFDANTPVYPEETGKEITMDEYIKWGSLNIYIYMFRSGC